jgi:23S rRNA pseudouridine1911/1915/1917 synthase
MKPGNRVNLKVKRSENGLRLDKFLKQRYPEWGRNAIKKLVNSKKIKVNDKLVWYGSWELKENDLINLFTIPKSKPKGMTEFDPSWIIAEDDNLIAVNKPSGLRSHTTRVGGKDNLLDLARNRWGDVDLFHRLDRDTSGITMLTKTRSVNQYLDQAFKSMQVEKTYLAITGAIRNLIPEGKINRRIGAHPSRKDMRSVVEKGGQMAVTEYHLLSEVSGKLLFAVHPRAGRMHQIRVHLKSLGSSILGDVLYGTGKQEHARLYLHAAMLVLPESDKFQRRAFVCPPGIDFTNLLSKESVDLIKEYLA